MKTTTIFSFYLGLATLLFSGCDKIDEPFIRKAGGNGGHDTTQVIRKILLEEYTGHTCVNCPGAAIKAHELQHQYPGRVILMTVHAGWFARPAGSGLYVNDFRTPEGEELDQFFGVSAQGNPQGMVNRTGEGTARVLKPELWDEAVGTEMTKPAEAHIEIISHYTEQTRTLKTTLKATFIIQENCPFRISAFITEDSIVAPQKNNDPTIGDVPDIEDYVHMHMLRGSLNGTWGDLISDEPVVKDSVYTVQLPDMVLPAAWNDENCSVVAFIFRQTDYVVKQAEEKRVK